MVVLLQNNHVYPKFEPILRGHVLPDWMANLGFLAARLWPEPGMYWLSSLSIPWIGMNSHSQRRPRVAAHPDRIERSV